MKILLKYKYLVLLSLLIIILMVLYSNGKKSIHHEIYINASTENVFGILIDTDNYDKWNPIQKVTDGKIVEGNTITYQNIIEPKTTTKTTIKKVVPNKLINQTGGIPLIQTFDHKYILEKDAIGTKLIIHEDYSGIVASFMSPTKTAISYSKLASALEQYAESK